MHRFTIVSRVACSSLMGYLVHRYIVSISVRQRKLLIDKDMKKKDLCEKAGISPASVTKMGRNGHVTTEILVKICAALDCGIEDIVEIVPDD